MRTWTPTAACILLATLNVLPEASGQDAFAGELLHEIDGRTAWPVGWPTFFGGTVTGAGDVDADGFGDIAVGDPWYPSATSMDRGGVLMISGKDGTTLWTRLGQSGQYGFGTSLDTLGDLDLDGVPDLAVGAPGNGGVLGYVRILSGATGAVLQHLTAPSPADGLGTSVAGPGDMDGDGWPDVLAGARYTNFPQGAAYALSSTTGAVRQSWLGASGIRVGDVGAVGDLDQDGFADAGFGWRLDFDLATVQLRSGQNGLLLHQLAGKPMLSLEDQIAGDVDLDQDGFPDVVVGADSFNGAFLASGLAGFSGQTGGLAWRADFLGNDDIGVEPKVAGDIDGDGIGDLFVRGPWFPNTVRAFSAKGTQLFEVPGIHTCCDYPYQSIDGAGDVDGDGLPDLVVGWGFGNFILVYRTVRCGPVTVFGSGCPATGPETVSLAVEGCPRAGHEMSLRVTAAFADANLAAFVVAGAQPAATPLPNGCTLLVGGPQLHFVGPLPLVPQWPSATATVPVAIPAGTPPGSVAVQAFVSGGNTRASAGLVVSVF